MNSQVAERREQKKRTCRKCETDFEYEALIGMDDGVEKELFKPIWCPACVEQSHKGKLQLERSQTEHERRFVQRDRESQLRELLEQIGANAWEHGESTLDNFDVSEAGQRPVTLAREFAAATAEAGRYDPVRGLYIGGPTGTGKTHLAVAVCRALFDAGYPGTIVFDHAAELIARIQDTYGRKEESTFDVLEKRFDAGLWVLDDFGTERPTDDVIRHLTLIFARRALRPTLITSNLGPDRLDKERPELLRVLSRLGPKYFRVCEVAGRDRRFD